METVNSNAHPDQGANLAEQTPAAAGVDDVVAPEGPAEAVTRAPRERAPKK